MLLYLRNENDLFLTNNKKRMELISYFWIQKQHIKNIVKHYSTPQSKSESNNRCYMIQIQYIFARLFCSPFNKKVTLKPFSLFEKFLLTLKTANFSKWSSFWVSMLVLFSSPSEVKVQNLTHRFSHWLFKNELILWKETAKYQKTF